MGCSTALLRTKREPHGNRPRGSVYDQVRALANTEAFQLSRRERKKVEVRFAHMKGIHKLGRLRLRGLSGAKDEVLLTATAKRFQTMIPFGRSGAP